MGNLLNEKTLYLQKIDKTDLMQVEGGLFGIDDFLVGVAVAAAVAIINDWDNFERGLTGQPYKKN